MVEEKHASYTLLIFGMIFRKLSLFPYIIFLIILMTFDILRVVQVYGKKMNSRFSHWLNSNFIPMVSKMFEFSIFGYIIKFAIKKRVGNRKK